MGFDDLSHRVIGCASEMQKPAPKRWQQETWDGQNRVELARADLNRVNCGQSTVAQSH